jgi:hypothetical protein
MRRVEQTSWLRGGDRPTGTGLYDSFDDWLRGGNRPIPPNTCDAMPIPPSTGDADEWVKRVNAMLGGDRGGGAAQGPG